MSQKQARYTAKASVFEDLFSDENNLLELYKVLHPEDVTATVDDLKHVTIKNIVTTGRYNDLGFMVRNRLMILVEAQSTWSVNIIPRCIMYLAETWNRYFLSEAYNIYGSAPVEIPEPELYVIYTGSKKIKKEYITLSEEFFDGKKVAVDAEVKVLEYTSGSDIVDQYIFFCKTLDEQRELYPEDGLKAVNETIRICLEAGVLTEYLQNRTEEVVSIMLTLYSQEQATDMMLASAKKESLRTGLRKGQEIGLRKGQEIGLRKGQEIGLRKGQIQATVEMCREFGKTEAETISILSKKFALTQEEAAAMMCKYSQM